MAHAIGIDLGGTKINIGLVDQYGKIIDKILVKTDVEGGPTAIIGQMRAAVEELQIKHQAKPIAVGVGLAGQISREGAVSFAPNLRWRLVPFKELLEKEIHLPVAVLNDVRAATYAEWKFGEGQGCQDLVCLFVGTGIGGGIVSGGHLLEGANNSAGELGHIVIDMHGPKCTCGNFGCWEAYAGGWGIAERAREMIVINPKKGEKILSLADNSLEKVTAKAIAEAYHDKDHLAQHIVKEISHAFVAGSISVINALNPSRLIFGGGVIKGIPEFVQAVREGVKHRALPSSLHNLQIVEAKIVTDAGLIGAATYALEAKT